MHRIYRRPSSSMRFAACLSAALAAMACGPKTASHEPAAGSALPGAEAMPQDPHSYARPQAVAVRHLGLDLRVDFAAERLEGRASLTLDRRDPTATELVLDTRDLDIRAVRLDDEEQPVAFSVGDADPLLGAPLRIPIGVDTAVVHIDYATDPGAAALQWLAPAQTAGGEHPFLFTQSQAILARTWVPCQDSPAVRMTYEAVIRTSPQLMAVMSADGNPAEKSADGVYRFAMRQPIPSYLLALGVGDLAFASMGPRTGVYAEPAMVEAAAYELADTEDMITAVESLYGPYRWGRYDLLVLPPSFPFGGMENPRLTFATPTIIAGDRSLVSLVAHELAHSWSGNLVTNATWNDFWLNEGFTVYLERRIMEALRGSDYADMLALLGRQDLEETLAELGETNADTHLLLDLAGRDPDDGMSDIAYEKGYFFLRAIEDAVGRERFDAFLRRWFDEHAFTSETTAGFVSYLERELIGDDAALAAAVDVDAWVEGPGIPGGTAPASAAFERVDEAITALAAGGDPASLATGEWSTHEWLHFLRGLPDDLGHDRMAELDGAFGLTETGNAEVLHAWLHHVIASRYQPAYPRLRSFLVEVGRRKFLKPLYERLAETEDGLAMAREIYAEARPGYHAVSSGTIDEILAWQPEG